MAGKGALVRRGPLTLWLLTTGDWCGFIPFMNAMGIFYFTGFGRGFFSRDRLASPART
jgi:hypothetical protein